MSTLSHILKERTELREDRAYDCGSLMDAVGSKNRTHPPLEQDIT